jgi:hypothetical protein
MSRKQKNVLPHAVVPIRVYGRTVARVIYCGPTEGDTKTILQIHCSNESEATLLAIRRSYYDSLRIISIYGEGNKTVTLFEVIIQFKVDNPLAYVRKIARWTAEAAEDIEEATKTAKLVNKLAAEELERRATK